MSDLYTDNEYIWIRLSPFGVMCYNHYQHKLRENLWECPAKHRPIPQYAYPLELKLQIHDMLETFGWYETWEGQKAVQPTCCKSLLFEKVWIQ